MPRYIARRLVQLVPVLLGISFLVFLLVHLVPGDPVRVMLQDVGSPEQVGALVRRLPVRLRSAAPVRSGSYQLSMGVIRTIAVVERCAAAQIASRAALKCSELSVSTKTSAPLGTGSGTK